MQEVVRFLTISVWSWGVEFQLSRQSLARIFNHEPLSWRAKVTEGKNPKKARLPPSENMHAKLGDPTPWGYWDMLRTKSSQDFQWWAPILEGKGHWGQKPWKGITTHLCEHACQIGELTPWGYWDMVRTKSRQDFQLRAPILEGKGHWGQNPWKGTTTP